MFIRRTQTRSRISGEPYVTHRLVLSERVGSTIKQITLLNLGSHFDLPQTQWPALAQRIDELLHGQRSMLDATLPEEVQAFAQRFAAQIIARKPGVPSAGAAPTARADRPDPAPGRAAADPPASPAREAGELARYQEVDLDSLELVDPRSVGVEHAAAVGDAPMRLAGQAQRAGPEPPADRRRCGQHRRAHGPAGQRVGHARLAEGHLGLGRTH